MSKKKVFFKYKKERCLISDVLPFEVPVTFSNRYLYEFLCKHKVFYENDTTSYIYWIAGNPVLNEIIHILFGLDKNPDKLSTENRLIGKNIISFNRYKMSGKNAPAKGMIPFAYKIAHKDNEFRQLSIIHPRCQLEMTYFYDRCKETILYYCGKSEFSIRRPAKIAKFKYHRDKTHYANLADDESIFEENDKEYESLKSFFSYEKYSNIHKFYESPSYHECEKKFNNLYRLDISKCFDSIYTHSISWATLGRESTKENIDQSNSTFSGWFDKLMQNSNYSETNGIVIGPEFSRIFSEIILQKIDQQVLLELMQLESSTKDKFKHKKQFQIFRYVDDYFIFYNDEKDKNLIVEILQHKLKDFKLHLNASKAKLYEKPIITEITRAKQRISNLLEEEIFYDLTKVNPLDDNCKLKKGRIFVNSKSLITKFKTIIKECDVTYKEMLNYSLGIIERKSALILKKYKDASRGHKSEKELIKAIIAILEFTFFIYSVSPRVNTTIKLCRILRVFMEFIKSDKISSENRNLIFKKIYDDVCLILKKNKTGKYTQVETLYLLILLSELGSNYYLEVDTLSEYINLDKLDGGTKGNGHIFNYFTYTVVLFYIKNKKRYAGIKISIEKSIIKRFLNEKQTCAKSSELILLFFDMIACPYISSDTKTKLLEIFNVTDPSLQADIINFKNSKAQNPLWFTTWHNFNFGDALDAKRSQEVY